DLKRDAVKLSSIVIGTRLQPGARKNDRNPLVRDGSELVPNITHVVSAAQHLYFYYEVYDPARTPAIKLVTSIQCSRRRVLAFQTPPVETAALTMHERQSAAVQFAVPAAA